jgi:hypothetical protein
MSDDVQRDLGRMEADLQNLARSMDEIKTDLRQIRTSFDQVKGGSRVFMGMAAILGSGLTLLVNWLIKQ